MRRSMTNLLVLFPLGTFAGFTLSADLRHLPSAGREVQACENIHLGGPADDYDCDCETSGCGWAKDCSAGWEPCDDRTPDFVCHTQGHEGMKCVYSNGDQYGECPPPECSGDSGTGGAGGDTGTGGAGGEC
jgi:hypothetical protein